MGPNEKVCPYCAESIRPDAVKCRHCGEFLDDYNTNELSALQFRYYTRGISTALSTVWPGLGQMFQGRLAAGIAFFLAELLLWFFSGMVVIGTINDRSESSRETAAIWLVIIGIIHLINIYDAHVNAPGPNWDKDFRETREGEA